MVKKSKYYCENADCNKHLSEEQESGLGKVVLSGCGFYNFRKYSHCQERKKYISPEIKINTMKGLKRDIGKEAFQDLINEKSFLHVWRGTSPHNIWVAPINDENEFQYHSDGKYRPSLFCFEVVENSKEKIGMSLFGSENGSSYKSTYKLRKDFVEAYKNFEKKK
jgi:hypothetical protein